MHNLYNSKNDPLLAKITEVMKVNESERILVDSVNKHFGVFSRKALPHERQSEYDRVLAEARGGKPLTEAVQPIQEGVGEYSLKKTGKEIESAEDTGADDDNKRTSYDIHLKGKKVGEIIHNSYTGSINGKLHGRNLPDLSGYASSTESGPLGKLHRFLKSKTGITWMSRSNLKETTDPEQIQEISKETLKSYMGKVRKRVANNDEPAEKREKGIWDAQKRVSGRWNPVDFAPYDANKLKEGNSEDAPIEEASSKDMQRLMRQVHGVGTPGDKEEQQKLNDRRRAMRDKRDHEQSERILNKGKLKETTDPEQIQELKEPTLLSYEKKSRSAWRSAKKKGDTKTMGKRSVGLTAIMRKKARYIVANADGGNKVPLKENEVTLESVLAEIKNKLGETALLESLPELPPKTSDSVFSRTGLGVTSPRPTSTGVLPASWVNRPAAPAATATPTAPAAAAAPLGVMAAVAANRAAQTGTTYPGGATGTPNGQTAPRLDARPTASPAAAAIAANRTMSSDDTPEVSSTLTPTQRSQYAAQAPVAATPAARTGTTYTGGAAGTPDGQRAPTLDPRPATPAAPAPTGTTYTGAGPGTAQPQRAPALEPRPAAPTPAAPTGTTYPGGAPGTAQPQRAPTINNLAAAVNRTPAAATGPAPTPTPRENPERTAATTEPATTAPSAYTVQSGDSLWRIAQRNLPAGSTNAQIQARVNDLYQRNRDVIGADPNMIRPGQNFQL